MKKVLIAGIVGGVVMFCWGAISHMLLPIGEMGLSSLPNEEEILNGLTTNVTAPGLYFFPGIDMQNATAEQQVAWESKYKAGPHGLLLYHPDGEEPMPPSTLLKELASNIFAALAVAVILSCVSGSWWCRGRMSAAIGLVAWLSVDVSYWIWYGFPAAFIVGAGIDQVVGWLLAGLAMGRILPSTSCRETTACK